MTISNFVHKPLLIIYTPLIKRTLLFSKVLLLCCIPLFPLIQFHCIIRYYEMA